MRGSQAKWQSGHAKFASSALHGTKKRRLCLPPTKIIQKVDPIVIICAVTSCKGCNLMEDTEIRYLEAHTPSNLIPKPSRVLRPGLSDFVLRNTLSSHFTSSSELYLAVHKKQYCRWTSQTDTMITRKTPRGEYIARSCLTCVFDHNSHLLRGQ